MANSAQSRKRARQAVKRTLNKSSQRSAVRTAIKKVLHLIATDIKAAETEFRNTSKILDRAGQHNIIHARKADRLKSRLNSRLKNKALANG